MIPVVSRKTEQSTVGKVGSKYYWLYDQFTTNRAAGAVNSTLAEPVGGARTVTDTNSKITIASSALSFATGAVATDNVRWSATYPRQLGRTLMATVTPTGTINFGVGWTAAGGSINDGILGSGTIRVNGSAIAATTAFGGVATNIAVTTRTAGSFYFIKNSNTSNAWHMIYASVVGGAAFFPTVLAGGTTSIATVDNLRVPRQHFVPVPLASDGMSAATTDGLGNAENNGPTGASYTAVGTWGVTGGVRSCSALSGGLGLNYLATSSADVLMDAVCTMTGGVTGIVARYADAQNYLIAYHDGTNAKLDKVEGGTTTNLVSAAATYSATAVLRLVLSGTTARLFYNNAAVGTVATVPSSTAKNHGLYTTDTGATFDNLVIWARGTGDEYAVLDTL